MYRVLLVDDEEMVTQGLARFVPWAEVGFEVCGTATSVARALTFLECNPVDLVITDIQMPIQNGIDLIRILKEQYPQIKTIILSGYTEFSYAQQALRLGALDYLTKPVHFGAMKQLLQKVSLLLDKESKHQDHQLQQILADTLIQDYVNGHPFDEARAAICLDCSAPIVVVQMAEKEMLPLPESLTADIQESFAPCHTVSNNTQGLLVVLEHPAAFPVLRKQLSQLMDGYLPAIQLCAGVSEMQSGYSHLHLAAKQAAKALHYQTARSVAGSTFYEQVKEIFLCAGVQSQPETTTIHDLVGSLSTPEKRSQLLPQFHKLLYSVGAEHIDPVMQTKRFCTELLVEIDSFIQNMPLSDYPRHILLSETLLAVLAADSIHEIDNRMTQHLHQLLDRLTQMDETRLAGELIDRVKDYIGEHFSENLTLRVLAETFYVSPVYLSRLFKKKTGTNFVEYLTALRIEKAKKFLDDPSLKVYHVAEMVGYENPRYFARLFKEATGMVPQEYRNAQYVD